MALAGGLLRMVMIGCYVLAFCCAAIITGAFGWVSWFVLVMKHHG